MSRSLNRVTLIGNLGKDPEFRTTPQGASVCTLRMATTEIYKDRNGENQESTVWHNVVCWEKLAEIASQYLKKGSKIYIEGRIKYRSYEKEGVTRWVTDIVASNLIMLDSQRSSASGGESYDTGSSYSKGYDLPENPLDKHLSNDDDDVPF